MKRDRSASATDIPLLDIDRMSMRFGGLIAVSDLDLDVAEGDIVSLIGPNGAGKTTAFNCVSGMYTPTSGSVRFEGHRLTQSFGPGVFWTALAVGLIVGLFAAAAAVDIDRLWLAVVKRGMATDEPFTVETVRRRLRGYFRGELAIDQMAGRWRVVSADGREVLAIRRDRAEAQALRNQLQAAVTARRAGPGTIPDTTDMAGAASSSQPQAVISDEQLDRLADGKARVRVRGWTGLLAGGLLGAAGTIAIWRRGRRSPHVVARAGISRTFQNIRLFANMTVLENVLVGLDRAIPGGTMAMLFRTPANHRGEELARTKAREALQFVGLVDSANRIAGELPYGDQRRLEIARALATGARLILLDEPAAGMNPSETTELAHLIERIRDRGVTILLIEHHMNMVMKISNRVAVLDHGVKIADGKPADVKRNRQVIEAYLGAEA